MPPQSAAPYATAPSRSAGVPTSGARGPPATGAPFAPRPRHTGAPSARVAPHHMAAPPQCRRAAHMAATPPQAVRHSRGTLPSHRCRAATHRPPALTVHGARPHLPPILET
jgi:hypothetical protein